MSFLFFGKKSDKAKPDDLFSEETDSAPSEKEKLPDEMFPVSHEDSVQPQSENGSLETIDQLLILSEEVPITEDSLQDSPFQNVTEADEEPEKNIPTNTETSPEMEEDFSLVIPWSALQHIPSKGIQEENEESNESDSSEDTSEDTEPEEIVQEDASAPGTLIPTLTEEEEPIEQIDTAKLLESYLDDTDEDEVEAKQKKLSAKQERLKAKLQKKLDKKAAKSAKQTSQPQVEIPQEISDTAANKPKHRHSGKRTDPLSEEELEEKLHEYTQTIHLRNRILVFTAVILLLILGAVSAYMLRIKTITFENLTYYKAEDVVDNLGIHKNDSMLFLTKNHIEKVITKNYPYIQSVKVTYHYPDNITIRVQEDVPAYYVEIEEEYFVVSTSIRVLDRFDSADDLPKELKKLDTPQISYAVVGEEIRFFDSTYTKYLRSMLPILQASDVFDQMTEINLTNRYDIKFKYDNRLDITFGSPSDFDTKMQFLLGILDKLESDATGSINLVSMQTAAVTLNGS